jgi:phosphotransferase system enzyme I (PtsI)
MIELQGQVGAPGLARGRVLVVGGGAVAVERRSVADVAAETARLAAARAAVIADLDATIAKATAEGVAADEVKILKAHRMILADDEFYGEAAVLIAAERVNADWALQTATEATAALFDEMTSAYMQERARDIVQTSAMVIAALAGGGADAAATPDGPIILAARDLAPADTLKFDRARLAGLVTEIGGPTSHTVILAKGLGIPAVIGVAAAELATGAEALVDGTRGAVTLDPDAPAAAAFAVALAEQAARRQAEAALKDRPGATRDGVAVAVQGNLAEPAGVDGLVAAGAEGVGLFRSEFLFMDRADYPGEDEQYEAYARVARALAGRPLVIRTLDIGGDKQAGYMDLPKEDNPFLGYRAVRISLDRPAVFAAQLKAILRAGVHGDVAAMVPMIVSVDELEAVKRHWRAAEAALAAAGVPFKRGMKLGIMVETPAAAVLADDLAQRCDFFSIGTNDLIQYVTACDRLNPKVSRLYNDSNPAVLRLIDAVAAAGRRHGIPVSVCGEMGSDPLKVPLLVGMGLAKLSVAAGSIAAVKALLGRVDGGAARALRDRVLAEGSEAAVDRLLADFGAGLAINKPAWRA